MPKLLEKVPIRLSGGVSQQSISEGSDGNTQLANHVFPSGPEVFTGMLGTYNFSATLHWHRVTSDLNAGTVWLENSEWHSFRTNECTHTNIECTENLYSSWMSVIRRPRHPRNEAPKQQNNPIPIFTYYFLFKCHYPSKQQPRSPINLLLSRKPLNSN